jgi:hypothetical protein
MFYASRQLLLACRRREVPKPGPSQQLGCGHALVASLWGGWSFGICYRAGWRRLGTKNQSRPMRGTARTMTALEEEHRATRCA